MAWDEKYFRESLWDFVTEKTEEPFEPNTPAIQNLIEEFTNALLRIQPELFDRSISLSEFIQARIHEDSGCPFVVAAQHILNLYHEDMGKPGGKGHYSLSLEQQLRHIAIQFKDHEDYARVRI